MPYKWPILHSLNVRKDESPIFIPLGFEFLNLTSTTVIKNLEFNLVENILLIKGILHLIYWYSYHILALLYMLLKYKSANEPQPSIELWT